MLDDGLPSLFRLAHADAEYRQGTATLQRPLPDVAYQGRCADWLVEVMGWHRADLQWSLRPEYATHPWDGAVDPLLAACDAVSRGQDVAIESATGTGKTYLAAGVGLWFLAAHLDALVITVAPKEDQLAAQLWKEAGRMVRRFRAIYGRGDWQTLRFRLAEADTSADGVNEERERWSMIGWACGYDADEESAARAQGFHAKHMLILCEETPGIPTPVLAALRSTSVGTHNVMWVQGNPNHQQDTLHQFAVRDGVCAIRVSAYDHPNIVCERDVIPGATSRKGLAMLAETWGGTDTPMYRSRARGISPAQATNALIRAEWWDAAETRWLDREQRERLARGLWALGVDAAQSQNGDLGAICHIQGATVPYFEGKPCPDASAIGREAWALMQLHDIRPEYVGVDAVGVGASAYNELNRLIRELELTRRRALDRRFVEMGQEPPTPEHGGARSVVALYGSAAPYQQAAKAPDGGTYEWAVDGNLFANLRSQMYWQLAVDLRDGRLALAPNPKLRKQALMPTFTDEGKVMVEPKEKMLKRLGVQSPNELDALVYANWVRRRSLIPEPPPPKEMAGRDTNRAVPEWHEAQDGTIVADTHSTFASFGGGF